MTHAAAGTTKPENTNPNFEFFDMVSDLYISSNGTLAPSRDPAAYTSAPPPTTASVPPACAGVDGHCVEKHRLPGALCLADARCVDRKPIFFRLLKHRNDRIPTAIGRTICRVIARARAVTAITIDITALVTQFWSS
jgi:hypothetical protein